MSDIPLHPVLVHFPMALAALMPLAALAAWVFGLRSNPGKGRKYWAAIVALQALLAVSSFLAVQAGEKDEERVEKVLASEDPLESHAEKGEVFMKTAGAGLLITALGLAPGLLGLAGRVGGGIATVVILVLGIQVGHSGGQLVYKHGAAAAFIAGGAGSVADKAPGEAGKEGAGEKEEAEED